MSEKEKETKVTVDGEKYIVERNFLLGFAVTSKGNIYPIGEWQVNQGFVDKVSNEEGDNVVSVLPVRNGHELMVWTTDEKGEPESGEVGGYEVEGSIFNVATGGVFNSIESMVGSHIANEKMRKELRENEKNKDKR